MPDVLQGTQLMLAPCAMSWNFEWATPAISSPGAGGALALQIKAYPAACVDCDGCADGHNPHLWDCDEGNTNQWYSVAKVAGGSNVQLQNLRPDIKPATCLSTLSDASLPLIMKTCDANDSQQVFAWDASVGQLTSAAHAGMCVALNGIPCSAQRVLSGGNYSKIDTWCNPFEPAATRAAALVKQLTTAEKIKQLSTGPTGQGVPRLNIPGPWFNEALHGVASDCGAPAPNQPSGRNSTGCATSFSHGLALGSTFNRSLWTLVADAIGTEARALANQGKTGHAFWAPDINLARDPRWGRGQEVPGEDPFLNAEYILRYATAFQFGADYDATTGAPLAQMRREHLGHGTTRRNIATAKVRH